MPQVIGPTFDQDYYQANGQSGDRPALRFYTRLARRWLAPGRLLDFGCGTGWFLRRLSAHFATDGFETSPYARAAAERLVPRGTFHSELDTLPENGYSAIVSLHVLEHVPDPDLRGVLAAWRRALQPEGRVLCVIPELEGRGHRIKGADWVGFRDPTHVNLKTREAWIALLADEGFSVLKVGADGLWDLPYRKGTPKVLDAALHAIPTVAQFALGRLVLPPGSGESMILLLRRNGR